MKDVLFDDLGRKFLFVVAVVTAGFVLVLFKYSTSESWFTFVQWIGGFFFAANVGDKVTDKFKSKDQPPEGS